MNSRFATVGSKLGLLQIAALALLACSFETAPIPTGSNRSPAAASVPVAGAAARDSAPADDAAWHGSGDADVSSAATTPTEERPTGGGTLGDVPVESGTAGAKSVGSGGARGGASGANGGAGALAPEAGSPAQGGAGAAPPELAGSGGRGATNEWPRKRRHKAI